MLDICLCGIARDDCDYHKPVPVVVQVPVHDVSGTVFVAGVTNLTPENLYDAMALVLPSAETWLDFHVKVAMHIFDRLNNNGLIYLSKGQPCWQGSPIYVFPNIQFGPVYGTRIYAESKLKVILNTREW
jgi:hypothetical protein